MRTAGVFEHVRRRTPQTVALAGVAAVVALIAGAGCPITGIPTPPESSRTAAGVYNNVDDPTNGGASYIGSAACMACHPGVAPDYMLHAHAQSLHAIDDGAPTYPEAATRAGGFDPPGGRPWSDIAYVIGGYLRAALFVNTDGYVLTTGVDGIDTQWNLTFPDNGVTAGFVPYLPDQAAPLPYSYDCFVCHVTGAQPSDPDNPTFQDNRPGMSGTFTEARVGCEVCHGPGSNHAPNPAARAIYVDTVGVTCRECHVRAYRSEERTIRASGGYIVMAQQQQELWASGGHSTFSCLFCHAPHVSVNYDEADGIINDCQACHTDFDLGFHEGAVFVLDDYTEPLSCRSCHMPYATLTASTASPRFVGDVGRMADTHTHIFRINTDAVDYTAMFNDALDEVVRDAEGRAAVTVDFVCLRCHTGEGNAFRFTVESGAPIARSIHAGTAGGQ